MKLFFENSKGEQRQIAEGTLTECRKAMFAFLEEHNFKSYYQREITLTNGDIMIDVGSHTEFFYLKE